MRDFFDVLDASDSVSNDEALMVFGLLGPVVELAEPNSEVVRVARALVERMDYEALLTALLDWWLVTTTGVNSPTGLAHRLPDDLVPPLRTAMEAMVALDTSAPPVRWLQARGDFHDHLAQLDDRLQLDSYGAVKLSGERDAWEDLLGWLEPTVVALRASRRTSVVEWERRDFEHAIVARNIQKGSRRYREMLKRADELDGYLRETVELQRIAEPWKQRVIPERVDSIPEAVSAVADPITGRLLASIVPPSEEPNQRGEAEAIGDLAATADPRNQVRLVELLAPWRQAGNDVAPLGEVTRRVEVVRGGLEDLVDAGQDTTEIELALDVDHDLESAEQLVAAAKDAIGRGRQAASQRSQIEALRRRIADPDGVGRALIVRLADAESLLASGGDPGEVGRMLGLVEQENRVMTRDHDLAELESLFERLNSEQAPEAQTRELQQEIERLRDDPALVPQRGLVERFREILERHHERERDAVGAERDEVHRIVDSLRSTFESSEGADLDLYVTRVDVAVENDDLVAAREAIRDLRAELDRHRVLRWDPSQGEAALVAHVLSFCTQQLHFARDDVLRLYTAIKTKPFVILAGLTGSGKSTIARLFAEALGSTARNGGFRRIAVRPDWIDQSEVLGHVNPMSSRFEPGWLAHVALECQRAPERLFVVLLDEMNLAPVEQYLAEYLSALEESRSGSIPTLPLYSPGAEPENADEWPSAIPFPMNMVLIGTVNVDETTRALSERVLDRANVLQLSVEVSDSHHRAYEASVRPLLVPFRAWQQLCVVQPSDAHHLFLVELADTLRGAGIGVGARAHVELERFIANAEGVLDPVDALDLGILQRIIPKIRGFKRDLLDALEELRTELERVGCRRSAAVVARWLELDISDDEYLDGTDARIALYA